LNNDNFSIFDVEPHYKAEDRLFVKIVNEEKHGKILDCYGNFFNYVLEVTENGSVYLWEN